MLTSNGKYYVAVSQPDHARAAVVRWLTTGVLRINNPDLIKITACRLAYLPYCKVRCDYAAPWHAKVGELDNVAMQMAIDHYHSARAYHDSLPDHMRSSHRAPDSPNENNYVRWHNQSGVLNGPWESSVSMAAPIADHKLDQRVPAWANEMLRDLTLPSHTVWYSTFDTWSEYAGTSRDSFLAPTSDAAMIEYCIPHIVKHATKRLSKGLGKFQSEVRLSLDRQQSRYEVTDWTLMPVYIIGYEVGTKTGLCLVDGITAGHVVGTKVRDIMGGIKRWLKPVTSLFSKKAAPKLIGYAGSVSSDQGLIDDILTPQPADHMPPQEALRASLASQTMPPSSPPGFWQRTSQGQRLSVIMGGSLVLMLLIAQIDGMFSSAPSTSSILQDPNKPVAVLQRAGDAALAENQKAAEEGRAAQLKIAATWSADDTRWGHNPSQIRSLMTESENLNERCQGGSGDKPETFAACDRRDAVETHLHQLGWCSGKAGENYNPAGESFWHAC